jgi:hypothetical protein
MRVDTTPQVSGNRASVRIQTQYTFNGGLVIMDSVHMPTGCGTWPAFWTEGPNWPQTGEIDIVEGVNDYTNNQATVHTNSGCDLPTSNVTALGISGSVVGGTNCAALQTGNQGCGIQASQTNSFGAAFNNNGGGVYASAFLFFFLSFVTGAWMLTGLFVRQCYGITVASRSGSSPGTTFHPISPQTLPYPRLGAHPAHSGPQAPATRSSFSKTILRSSTPPSAVTGRVACGHPLGCPDRHKAAQHKLGSPRAPSTSSRTALHFPKPVRFIFSLPSAKWSPIELTCTP